MIIRQFCFFIYLFCSQSNGGRTKKAYNVGEKEQWCITTLGYVKTFSRQYAAEVLCNFPFRSLSFIVLNSGFAAAYFLVCYDK